MRLIILSTLLLFFNSIYTQEGSKIDLKNVDVATNRLPTILLFGDEYTIRDRDEFLESLIKSRFYSPDLEIVINLQEFISKRQFNFKHNGSIKINIDSRKLKNQNRYNSQIQSGIYISSFLRKVKSVRIDSSSAGTLERRALKNQINLIQKQIDSLDIEIRNNNINVDIKDSKKIKKLHRKKNQITKKLEKISVLEMNIFTE
tara:strand:+ start:543 stop:1148 length:606 start_codon:yes stop_codon:yes gene_type:complete